MMILSNPVVCAKKQKHEEMNVFFYQIENLIVNNTLKNMKNVWDLKSKK